MGKIILVISLLFSLQAISSEKPRGEFLGGQFVEVMPNWFKATFLDFAEDIEEAADEGRHVMIYFHQNGCPYCAKLVNDNFHNKLVVTKLKKDFDVIETNMWGDRDLADWEGREFTEKEFSAFMRVQFTPTIIFLNKEGQVVLRLNGYQSSEKLMSALDYVSAKKYYEVSFAQYKNSIEKVKVGKLSNDNKIFEKGPHDLARSSENPANKHLAVFFEEPACGDCDDFHKRIMTLERTDELFKPMKVIRLNAHSGEKIVTPSGNHITAKQWYDELKLTYKPSVVFFNKEGGEVIRKDAMFKSFHFHGIINYVTSGAYKSQPSFQRYLEHASDVLRDSGITVDIWEN